PSPDQRIVAPVGTVKVILNFGADCELKITIHASKTQLSLAPTAKLNWSSFCTVVLLASDSSAVLRMITLTWPAGPVGPAGPAGPMSPCGPCEPAGPTAPTGP